MVAATETVKRWNRAAGAWETVTVTVAEPARKASRRTARRTRKPSAPRDTAGLADGSPFARTSLAYTAYDQEYAGPLADTRTWLKPAAMRTHRAAIVMPADPGRITDTMTRSKLRQAAR